MGEREEQTFYVSHFHLDSYPSIQTEGTKLHESYCPQSVGKDGIHVLVISGQTDRWTTEK